MTVRGRIEHADPKLPWSLGHGLLLDQHHVSRVIAGLGILFEPCDHVARLDVLQMLDGLPPRGLFAVLVGKGRIEILGEWSLMMRGNLLQVLWVCLCIGLCVN